MVWTTRIRKVRFPKLNLHRELEAFVDICLILDDQDPKSEIYKIKFALWIRDFCRHLSFWTIRIRKLNLDLAPRSCKYIVNQVVWRIRIPKLNLDLDGFSMDLVPKSCKDTLNPVVWRIRIRKVRFSKLNLVPKYRHRQNRTNLWKCQQVMLNVYLLVKSMWIWHQNHAISL